MDQTYRKSLEDHRRDWASAQRQRVVRIIGGLPALEPVPTQPDPSKVPEEWHARLKRRRARAELEAAASVAGPGYDTPY